MTFGYACREAIPCMGCGLIMEKCVCEPVECSACGQNFDDYGYCGCRDENAPSMEEVMARFARIFGPDASLVEVEHLGPGRIAA